MRPTHISNETFGGFLPVGIYGWRKRCLYAFILLLMILVIMNLALTVWILRVLDFSIGGMGKLRILDNGIRVDGRTEFTKTLYTSKINSLPKKPLFVESSANVTIEARDKTGAVTNQLIIGENNIESRGDRFEIKDKKGRESLVITRDHIELYRSKLVQKGKAIFNGSIETPTVHSPNNRPLLIEAPDGQVKLVGHTGVNLISASGKVELKSSQDISFHSGKSFISFDAKGIYLKNLKINRDTGGNSTNFNAKVFQLCMCNTGRLFLAPPTEECMATNDACRR
ncbi:zeta-sarcoglycan [Octopus sinensis]|uniref:Zeta-sarcoglycan n=1 Tax=Octopus sinensis TaxID=2607531 RepID=A0A6P7T0N5_9MOLL|nr:zeta-sarcoglycan [Octopus sinensis]XP_036364430.1 zeta-sarcoglycan [Octopus sinensis]